MKLLYFRKQAGNWMIKYIRSFPSMSQSEHHLRLAKLHRLSIYFLFESHDSGFEQASLPIEAHTAPNILFFSQNQISISLTYLGEAVGMSANNGDISRIRCHIS